MYWFDDTGVGRCRVPASWRVLARDGEQWVPAELRSAAGVALDRFNRVEFDPIRTDAIRIEVALQPEYSGGMLECRLGIEGE